MSCLSPQARQNFPAPLKTEQIVIGKKMKHLHTMLVSELRCNEHNSMRSNKFFSHKTLLFVNDNKILKYQNRTTYECIKRVFGSGDGTWQLSVPPRPTKLAITRTRAYCACSRCKWRLFGYFLSCLSFIFFFILSGLI